MPCFLPAIEHIEHALLKPFMRFNHGWNREIILQFYATLYISGDLGNTSTWILEWMTGTEKIKCSADQFLALMNLPRCEFEKDRDHRLHFWDVSEAQLHLLMDPNLVGDECVDVDPKKLAYDNKVMFYILCNTLTPMNRPNSINGIMGNALLAISQGICFDVPDLFIRNLACAADSPQSLKPYAPWIMFAIEQLINEKFI
jgi:hypothetical protein